MKTDASDGWWLSLWQDLLDGFNVSMCFPLFADMLAFSVHRVWLGQLGAEEHLHVQVFDDVTMQSATQPML